jgi:glycerol uptake facilitator-like aquaporin
MLLVSPRLASQECRRDAPVRLAPKIESRPDLEHPRCFVAEVVLTCFFLIIIMGATDRRAPSGFAPIAIGLGLTLIHLIGIPVTNLSVNPARSTAPALFVGGWALAQLWLFWLAPIIGGALGAALYAQIFESGLTISKPVSVKSRTTVASG